MKTIITKTVVALAIAFMPFYAGAQQSVRHNDIIHRQHRTSNRDYALSPRQNTARTTGPTASRLIAQAGMQHNGTTYMPQDSTVYTYTGTRGAKEGIYGWNWLYDMSTGYRYTTGYNNDSKELITFDANNNPTVYVYQTWDAPTTSWKDFFREARTFNVMNKPVISTSQMWNNATSAWDSLYKYTDTYDGAGNLLTEIEQEWDGATASWQNLNKYTYTYSSANDMITELTEEWNTSSSAWENYDRSTYTYNTTHNLLTEIGQSWNVSAWENVYTNIYSNFASLQYGTAIYQSWNGTAFENSNKDNYTFNADNQPTYYYSQTWDGATSAWTTASGDYATRYYYETYTTAVKELSATTADVNVYPVPANNEVSVSIAWSKPQAFSITLMDMAGRMYTRQSIPATAQYNDKLSVANLPAGNYIISIESAMGKTTRKITVIK